MKLNRMALSFALQCFASGVWDNEHGLRSELRVPVSKVTANTYLPNELQ